jgi:hypothetical protein
MKRGVLHDVEKNDSVAVDFWNRMQRRRASSDDMATDKGMPELHGASNAEHGEEFDAARHQLRL